ncbi:MAG: STAS domain-containing protein [Acidimicrobiales bacterium]|nr:STAS domain-containing protein [Acidimicrobiales bacterium]
MTRAKRSPAPAGADQALDAGDARLGVIRLRGELDIATVSTLATALRKAVAAEGAVVVDLRDVDFMDASTIGVIVGARNLLTLQSRALTVRSPSVCVQRVLDVCGLGDLLDPESRPTGANPVMGASGALGTWVAVAAIERGPRRDDAAAGTSRGGDVSVVPAPTAADCPRRVGEIEATADHGA